MTSFIAKTFGMIAHQAETVVAVLGSSRTLMNSSIVPVVLSDDALWQRLCTKSFSSPHFRAREGIEHQSTELQQDILRLFVNFCDTMQFTERLTFFGELPRNFVDSIVLELSSTKRYFCRTLQHMDFVDQESIMFFCTGKFGNLRSCTLCNPSFIEPINRWHLDMLCDSRNFPRLQEFAISSFLTRDITDEQWQVLSKATSLEILNLLGSEGLASLSFLKGLKRLKELDLRYCHNLSVQSFTDLQIHHADANSGALLPSLESINLKENDFEITSSLLQFLLDHAPVMQVLKCDAPRSFEGAEIISEMRFLTKLSLDHCESLDAKCFEVLFSNLAHLENIRLEDAEQINDTCLLHLSQTRSPVKKLALSPCVNVTNEGLGQLTRLNHLEVFELDGGFYRDSINLTGDIGEKNFAQSLTKLTLYSCSYFTDAGLASTLKSLSCLRELYLNCVPEKLTSEGLKIALEGSRCQNTLELLDLDSQENNSAHDLRFVKGLKALKRLDFWGELDLNAMRGHSEKGFGALSSCSRLTSLSVYSTGIRDTDIVDDFPTNLFDTLEVFRVRSYHLTDFGLVAGISKMRNLRELNISSGLREEKENADPYTIAGVLHVVQHLPHLHRLEVRDEIAGDIHKDTGLVGKKVGPLFGNYVE